jgi:hypothetical protein
MTCTIGLQIRSPSFWQHLLQVVAEDPSAIWHLRTFNVLGLPSERGFIQNTIPTSPKFEKSVAEREVSANHVSFAETTS